MGEAVVRHGHRGLRRRRHRGRRRPHTERGDQLHGCRAGGVLLLRVERRDRRSLQLRRRPGAASGARHLRCSAAHSRLGRAAAHSDEELPAGILERALPRLPLLHRLHRRAHRGGRRLRDGFPDIGDAAFLLGPGSFAASCSAAEHGLKNGCVYLADDNNDVHIFHLKEGTRES